MSATKHETREAWLLALVAELRPMFAAQGQTVPDLLVSVGWPSVRGIAAKNRRIGECWSGSCSADGRPHVFISPMLADPVAVAAVVVHELVHATVGCEAGHKGPFRKLAVALGLEGKMTATTAGESLTKRLNAVVERIGAYPHPALTANPKAKKQGTRMLKLVCDACGYVARTTAKWLEIGVPTCCCGGTFAADESV